MATFRVLDPVVPPHRMELDDGRIRMVRMHGWLSQDLHETYNDFLANTPEQDAGQVVLINPLRRGIRILCNDRLAPWYGLPCCIIYREDVPNIVEGDYLFVGYTYHDRGTRDPRRLTSTRFWVCWRPGQPPPHHLEDMCQLRLLLGAAEAPLPEEPPVEDVPSLWRVDVAFL
jgi:hypothetical protein